MEISGLSIGGSSTGIATMGRTGSRGAVARSGSSRGAGGSSHGSRVRATAGGRRAAPAARAAGAGTGGGIRLAAGASAPAPIVAGSAAEDKSGAAPVMASRKPTGCRRAKTWTVEVENSFRIQELGWRNEDEYAETYGVPDRWEESGFIKAVRVKETGYIVYWRKYRECEDKYVNRVKLFSYE